MGLPAERGRPASLERRAQRHVIQGFMAEVVDKRTGTDRMAKVLRKLYDVAMEGDVRACEFLVTQVVGLPARRVDIGIDASGPALDIRDLLAKTAAAETAEELGLVDGEAAEGPVIATVARVTESMGKRP